MRLRNVSNAKELLIESKYFIENAEEYKNKWNTVFNNDNPIMLEIGMGKGNFLIGMAIKYPNINFIGIEKYESVQVRAKEKLDNLELPNIKLINCDAQSLNQIFGKEIDKIYLNFSDPWPKKRHHKRRLTHETFLKIYDEIFKDNCEIEFKTDNDSLFESSLIYLNNYGYKFECVSLDLWNTQIENVLTEYEIKFSNKGFKIKYLKAKKMSRQNE